MRRSENHDEIGLACLSEECSAQSLLSQFPTSAPRRSDLDDAIATVDDRIDDDANSIAVDPSPQSIHVGWTRMR